MKKLLVTALLCSALYGVPAYQGEIEFKQKDGSIFKGHLKGDEYFSWVEDKYGHIIKYNKKSKDYEYAKLKEVDGKTDLVPSGIMVSESSFLKQGAFVPSVSISKKQLSEIWSRKKSETKYHH